MIFSELGLPEIMINSYRKISPGGIFRKTFQKKGVTFVEFLCGILVGIFVGAVLGIIVYPGKKTDNQKPSGTFVIDFSDPLKDICRLELAEGLESLYSKKQMTLTIETHGEDSLK